MKEWKVGKDWASLRGVCLSVCLSFMIFFPSSLPSPSILVLLLFWFGFTTFSSSRFTAEAPPSTLPSGLFRFHHPCLTPPHPGHFGLGRLVKKWAPLHHVTSVQFSGRGAGTSIVPRAHSSRRLRGRSCGLIAGPSAEGQGTHTANTDRCQAHEVWQVRSPACS